MNRAVAGEDAADVVALAHCTAPGQRSATTLAIQAAGVAPPVVRFLEALTVGETRPLRPFVWGSAAGLPYLPRAEVGRAILAPAQ